MTAAGAAVRQLRTGDAAGAGVPFDPRSAEFRADPFPLLRRLREADPVHRSPQGFWLLTRYDDVSAVLRDSRRFGSAAAPSRLRAKVGSDAAFAYFSRRMPSLAPPRHEQVRSVLSQAFGAARIKALRPRIAAIVESLIDEAGGGRRMEFMSALAHPLPSLVICEVLGLPRADAELLSAWTGETAFLVESAIAPERLARAQSAAAAAMAYAQDLIRERARKPAQDDLIGLLTLARENDGGLTEEEIAATIVFLFAASHQTTRDLLGNGLIALLRNPVQWQRLASNAELLPAAVEECLRYDPSVAMSARWALEDTVIDGKTIATDDHVMVSISAANRDPARFPDPDRFDIGRLENRHLSFGGGGVNHCLGSTLARLEAQIVFGRLAGRFPGLRLERESIQWRELTRFRSPIAVHVAW